MERVTARDSAVPQATVVGQGTQARAAVKVVVDAGNGPASHGPRLAAATGGSRRPSRGRGAGATGRQLLND